ncbi:hypothetical protein QJS83_05910 [Bdellovibrio sp. 22V]|uniref:hypothetical protein n=1 Tax=Bdellovibrio sp. 22V TaxID=3044166 RepID=UPI0025435393|nr:hypothetical protein [Bdellovibrio sp. 22V]WII73403.1 hypothetical protein QJS83_05910 [Bdellovibrio sp. 22V]
MTLKRSFTKVLILAALLVSFQNCAPVGKSVSPLEATSSPEDTTAFKLRPTPVTTTTEFNYTVTVDDPQNSLGADRDLILKNL